MTICNTCTLNVLDAHAAFVDDREARHKRSTRGWPRRTCNYSGRTRISHFLWVLYEDIGEARLRALVQRPLTGLTVAAFYGCHITRPPQRYGFVDSRNNIALERLAEILGCRPIDYSGRTECCGFHTAAHDERIAIKLTGPAHPVGQDQRRAGHGDALPALPHGARRLSARDREGPGPEARHARSCICRSWSAWRSGFRPKNCASTGT